MVKKVGLKIFQNHWNGNRKSFLKNLPVKAAAAANGANTSRKECNIDGQHRRQRNKIITALHSHHKHLRHLQGLFCKKLGILVCKYLGKSAVSFFSSCLKLKPLFRSNKVRLQSIINFKNNYSFVFNCIILQLIDHMIIFLH